MMKPSFIFTLFIFSLLFSCKKDSEKSAHEIYGKWKLVESLADPGDGSGKWTKAKEKSYLQLNRDGSVMLDMNPELSHFKIIDSVNIEFTFEDRPDEPLQYRYSLKGNQLELNPPCFEPCGQRYKRD